MSCRTLPLIEYSMPNQFSCSVPVALRPSSRPNSPGCFPSMCHIAAKCPPLLAAPAGGQLAGRKLSRRALKNGSWKHTCGYSSHCGFSAHTFWENVSKLNDTATGAFLHRKSVHRLSSFVLDFGSKFYFPGNNVFQPTHSVRKERHRRTGSIPQDGIRFVASNGSRELSRSQTEREGQSADSAELLSSGVTPLFSSYQGVLSNEVRPGVSSSREGFCSEVAGDDAGHGPLSDCWGPSQVDHAQAIGLEATGGAFVNTSRTGESSSSGIVPNDAKDRANLRADASAEAPSNEDEEEPAGSQVTGLRVQDHRAEAGEEAISRARSGGQPGSGSGSFQEGAPEASSGARFDQSETESDPGSEWRKALKEEQRRQARRVFPTYILQESQNDLHLWAASWLRAESYCEDQPYVRYVESFKKRFAEQEFVSLKKRVVVKYGRSLKCICFVAVALPPDGWDNTNGPYGTALRTTLGTLDISMRQLAPGEVMPGVQVAARSPVPWQGLLRRMVTVVPAPVLPVGSFSKPKKYGYIANVCVKKSARRQGIAYALLQVALEAASEWGLKDVYCHVDAGNRAAYKLYKESGFEVVGGEEEEDKKVDAVKTALDRTILLRITL